MAEEEAQQPTLEPVSKPLALMYAYAPPCRHLVDVLT
jgi:hypothetical protein